MIEQMEQRRYKPSQAARILGVHPWTMRRWLREGNVPSIKSETGRWYIPASWIDSQIDGSGVSLSNRCAIYVRESSSENKAALQSQLDGMTQYATAKGYQIVRIVSEVASGLNDHRPKLEGLLRADDFDILLVEHKERLTRFGFHWFEVLSPFKIEVVNLADNATNDLMEDLVAIITSFAARLYGQRRGRKKTEAAIKAIQDSTNDQEV